MFEPSLVADAWAATAGAPPPSGSDPQTIMYIVGGIVSGIVVGIGTLLYRKAPNGQGPTPTVHVDVLGPYQQIFDRLGAAMLALERIAGGHIETREATAKALQTTRHDLKAALQQMNQAQEADMQQLRHSFETAMDEIKRLMRKQNEVSDRLDEFIRAKLK